jgi:hypothetical protein
VQAARHVLSKRFQLPPTFALFQGVLSHREQLKDASVATSGFNRVSKLVGILKTVNWFLKLLKKTANSNK